MAAPQLTQPPVINVPAAPTPAPIAPPLSVLCSVSLRFVQPVASPKVKTEAAMRDLLRVI